LNNKGQFSIIAALLVAVVLIGAVMATYSAIRYSPVQAQPQILSAVDETNQALKQLLGFTVGYYGSVLRVTGNVTYAQQLATTYLNSGLENVGSIKPDWGLSLNASDLKLSANWFTNDSYSQGSMNVTYDLNGLGITGISYSASSRLEVQVSNASSPTQAQFKILTDDGEPLINLGSNNIKFYHYAYGNLTWDFSVPTNIVSHGDGTYLVDLPSGVSSSSYVVQVEDTRGLSVLASSFSKFTSTIAWNSSAFKTDLDYVDSANLNVLGTHSNFSAQQNGPDGVFDTLTEAASGTTIVPSYPTNYNTYGSTTLSSGSISNLTLNDGVYMTLGSYGSSPSSQTLYAHQETAPISSSYYLKLVSSDQSGSTLSASAKNNGRQLIGKFIYQLAGISSIPASSGTIYYRAYRDSNVAGYCDADIVVRQSNGNLRATLAQNTASTGSLTTSPSTLSGTYSTATYNVVDQTDYLEIDYYMEVTLSRNGQSLYLTIDNNSLTQDLQTRITNINLPTLYTAQIEFTGSSIESSSWNNLMWTIDSSASISGVNATFQLYNWTSGRYSNSGYGFLNTILATSDTTLPQTITTNPSNFLNSSGYWKIMVTTVMSTSFNLNLDLIQYSPQTPNYAVNLQEQWLNVNATNLRQDLCIKTGTMGSEPLLVQVWHSGIWQNLTTLMPNYFNNASLAQYIDSSTLTIRFVDSNNATDPTQDSWNIDSVYLQDEPDISFLLNLQQSTFTLELLQNGTMRWLGQNMQTTTQTLPIPPIPVKAIHVNETINGVNQEVPFQIEDWASNYQIPVGLTSNSTVFGNRQMIVFLLNGKVTDFTVWWDGSDVATQTPMAFTNRYFVNDNTGASTLTNGNVTLLFGNFNVKATVTGSGNSSTATFMRINQQASTYGAGAAYVIQHGIVRDVVEQEAEWNNGPTGCPNLYANIVLTLPANATYYTYQLRIMFINSTQARSITDLCPIQLTTTLPSVQTQTENGTFAGFPTLQNGTATFSNSTVGSWTPHHFSQFISGSGKGAGIMFTDNDNQRLYALDSIAGHPTGSLNVTANSPLIELLPVDLMQVQFMYSYDVTWQGAVVTFDGTTPLCSLYDGTTPMGLWILAKYPPTLTVTAKS
jgi:hypothetical protein